jgi:hypothetical protein
MPYNGDPLKLLQKEYQSIAGALFPENGEARGECCAHNARDFAEILGIGAEFSRLFSTNFQTADFQAFLEHFRKNLSLIITKTWVEKCDEARKDRLKTRLPNFILLIKKSEYRNALNEFGLILDELLSLLFGNELLQEDFIEYTLRIDTQIGLFCWYGRQLKNAPLPDTADALRAFLLIGLCYLTNF